MKYERAINILQILQKKSLLLVGPRQTGKTSLAKTLPNHQLIDLSESDTFREISARPELIRQRLSENTEFVVIDEAQRIPEVFNEVQLLIDRNPHLRVLLTGSSARKLRRQNINLLPGRIWRRELFPLVSNELGAPRLEERAVRGSLPGIIDSPDYRDELKAYVGLYLDEEVRAEGLTRDIGAFSRFLNLAALTNAAQVNYTKIANDIGVAPNTVRGYYEILDDTLIGCTLPTYRKTTTRKAVAIPKFYFFDLGVVNALLNRFEVSPESELYGKALEHIVHSELRAYLSYSESAVPLSYWRSQSRLEVDFVLGDQVAIEVKASTSAHPRDERGLKALAEDIKLQRRLIVCRERLPRKTDSGIEVLPVEEFLSQLWEGEII